MFVHIYSENYTLSSNAIVIFLPIGCVLKNFPKFGVSVNQQTVSTRYVQIMCCVNDSNTLQMGISVVHCLFQIIINSYLMSNQIGSKTSVYP